MDSWRWGKYLPHESAHIYKEDELLFEGKISLAQESQKYNIDTLLFPVLVKNDDPIMKQIHSVHWKQVYSDNIAVIYQKKLGL